MQGGRKRLAWVGVSEPGSGPMMWGEEAAVREGKAAECLGLGSDGENVVTGSENWLWASHREKRVWCLLTQ